MEKKKITNITYCVVRNTVFRAMNCLMLFFFKDSVYTVDTHVLLWGDNAIGIAENEMIFYNVQLFLKRSARF